MLALIPGHGQLNEQSYVQRATLVGHLRVQHARFCHQLASFVLYKLDKVGMMMMPMVLMNCR